MKIRNLLFGFVLSVILLCAGSFRANTVQASACTNFCLHEYNNCMIDCNGAPSCQQICRDDYYCCLEACNGEECDLGAK
jgi:hypothetical protein